jgi:hypothetical protein
MKSCVQLIAILPNVIKSDDVRMLKKLHDCDLPFESIRDRLVSGSTHCYVALRTLDEVGQALRSRGLCGGPRDDLDSAILMPCFVPNDSDSRAAPFSNCLA